MSPETLEALRGSIAKWRAIVAGDGEDNGVSNCPLCQIFYEQEYEEDEDGEPLFCVGCPVRDRTGTDNCAGTPWVRWARLHQSSDDNSFPWYAHTPEEKLVAQAELDFLISLLPEGEAP